MHFNGFFDILFRKHSKELISFASLRAGNAAEDLVQEAYLRLLQHPDPTSINNPRAYLYKVAANVSFDHHRKETVRGRYTETDEREPDSLVSPLPGPEALMEGEILLRNCLEALKTSKLGGQVNLDGKTASRYIGIFEQMYLLRRIDVWSHNRLNRVVKSPKLQFIDSGLLSTLIDLSIEEIYKDRTQFGNILESFVFGELLKHTTTAEGDYRLMYYRDADKFEVDIVIENAAGQLVAVEVNAAATIKITDLRGLKKFANIAGDHFRMGVLLYDGTETLPLGNELYAVPLSSLWGV